MPLSLKAHTVRGSLPAVEAADACRADLACQSAFEVRPLRCRVSEVAADGSPRSREVLP